MANIALVTANKVEVVESVEQKTIPCAVDITAGAPVNEDANGKWVLALATTAAAARGTHVATRTAVAGEALTAIKRGIMDGFVLDALAYDAPVYLSDTGTLADTTGTVGTIVGTVMAGWAQPLGTAADKLLKVATPDL